MLDLAGIVELAFPYDEREVALPAQRAEGTRVARAIRGELFQPELAVSFRYGCTVAATVCVPEAAVDEHGPSPCAVRRIGCSWEIPVAYAESQAERMKHTANGALGGSVFLADTTETRGRLGINQKRRLRRLCVRWPMAHRR